MTRLWDLNGGDSEEKLLCQGKVFGQWIASYLYENKVNSGLLRDSLSNLKR